MIAYADRRTWGRTIVIDLGPACRIYKALTGLRRDPDPTITAIASSGCWDLRTTAIKIASETSKSSRGFVLRTSDTAPARRLGSADVRETGAEGVAPCSR